MTIERPGTDHVISGPMRGLKQNSPDGADSVTHGHGDIIIDSNLLMTSYQLIVTVNNPTITTLP